MKVLDGVKSKELLLKKVNTSDTNGMESIMTQILEKCDGLPLAISVVGGLLVGKQTIREWEEVLEEMNDHLGREESRVSAILELSYQNLSPQLKSCLLCLVFFKEDATIPVKWLEDMWISQCLIQHEENRAAHKIARGYLNELINRSMIQVKDVWFDDRVESCEIPDLVREVCLRKAKEEMRLEVVKKEAAGSSSATATPTPSKARHLVVYDNNLVTSKTQNKSVRSLFLVNVDYEDKYLSSAPTGFWESFKLLQTLHIEGFAFTRLRNSIRSLTRLKILRIILRSGVQVLELSNWFDNLKNLEVLTVNGMINLSTDVGLEIEKLRHLDATCLRGFRIGNCKSLETLRMIPIDEWVEYSSTVKGNSSPLRELGIQMYLKEGGWRDDKSSMVRASWLKMTNLVELHIDFVRCDLVPLGEVIRDHLNSLTTLKVSRLMTPISTTPAAMFPSNLSHLILHQCILSDDDGELMELGNFPNLRYLTLLGCRVNKKKHTRRIAIPRNAFPCLEVFSLQNMGKLTEIDIEEGGMPLLKELKICDCPNLETHNLPQHILISQVPQIVLYTNVHFELLNGIISLH